jgi:hypothetical protein
MTKTLRLAVAGLGMLFMPAATFAEPINNPMVVAQDFDVRVGPGGVRVGGDRYEGGERFRERDSFGERSYRREYREERYREPRRFVERREGCRTVIVRRQTDYGVRVQRIRRCG